MTSGFGTGDFAPFNVALGTPFGPFTLTDATISTGGGFSISNPQLGTFNATGGSIANETPESLVVDLSGTYDPGPKFTGETAAPAHVVLGFTEIDGATSASMAMATTPVPEPGTLVTMGTGLCGIVAILAVECWFDYRRHNLLYRTRIGASQAGAMRAPACAADYGCVFQYELSAQKTLAGKIRHSRNDALKRVWAVKTPVPEARAGAA